MDCGGGVGGDGDSGGDYDNVGNDGRDDGGGYDYNYDSGG